MVSMVSSLSFEGLGVTDELWRAIVREIPSHHMEGRLADYAFGFRREFMLVEAKQYLEIGCRLGHSLAASLIASKANAMVVDSWIPYYGAERNEGPRVVAAHLYNLHINPLRVDFRTGDSHVVLPKLLGLLFDRILVDGDRSEEGAKQDLIDSLPLLAPNGILYLDDFEPPLENMAKKFALDNHLNLDVHEREGEAPAWCTMRR